MRDKGQLNRVRIVESAMRLFHERGIGNTSFNDIAQASGIPKGNIYYYFKTKEDLLQAVVETRVQMAQMRYDEIDTQLDKPLQRLHRFIELPLVMPKEHYRFGCAMGSLALDLSKEPDTGVNSSEVELFDVTLNWLERQFVSLGKPTPRDLAYHLFTCVQGSLVLNAVYRDQSMLEMAIRRMRAWIDAI